jgi:DNA-binding transcriptional MerR regulator
MGDVIELVAREKTYSGREVAEILGIGASTLRKWSMLLEQHGYWFLRDSQNRREYRQMDVAVLQRFYRLTKDQLYPQEEAAHIIASHQLPEPVRMETAAALAPRIQTHNNVLEEKLHALAVHVQQQDAAHQALLERMEKQEAYIRSNLKERDRRLTKAMNDIMDAKIQLSRMKDEQRKTSIWQKLFRLH